jgi:signal transduction histidine kinase
MPEYGMLDNVGVNRQQNRELAEGDFCVRELRAGRGRIASRIGSVRAERLASLACSGVREVQSGRGFVMIQGLNQDGHLFGPHERSNPLWLSGSRYMVALVATAIAFAATFTLKRVLPTPSFLFFIPAITLSAWYGGRGPSILATALSLLLITHAFEAPVGSLSKEEVTDLTRRIRGADLLEVVAFIMVALTITVTMEALVRARALAESRTQDFERVNEELRHALVSRRLLAEQETERGRISRVLHDDVGQLLTALRLNLQRVTLLDRDDEAVIRDSIGLVDETLTHVRALSVELRPTVLDDLGLGEAVAWYANRQAERAGYAVVVEQALGEGRLPEAIETAGFRIVQQAVTNIARHAKAKNVRIVLRRDSQTVELAVVDDGIGFDVPGARIRSQAGESLGLVDMTELAYMAGGILTITSTKGKGSTVRVQFPLDSV